MIMIRLSINILYATCQMLKRMNQFEFSSVKELFESRITSIDSEEIFVFATKCEWVFCNQNEKPELTIRGNELLKLINSSQISQCFRCMLKDYIACYSPVWSRRIPYGRKESAIFMTKDELVCFDEAGLLDENPDVSVTRWWDQISALICESKNEINLDLGRAGEMLTLKYEKLRTGIQPQWIAIDSNLVGYDIKSKVSRDDNTPLLIEVKATRTSISEAFFHISDREWEVASVSKNHLFYLWIIKNNQNELAIVNSDQLKKYIPTNNIGGLWESAKIPYVSFANSFKKVN